MGNQNGVDEVQMSFVVHLWLKDPASREWRGRVTHDGSEYHAFDDEQRLLDFIRERLRAADVLLPARRSQA
ncbi:hypothetical protein X770_00945 [Mesorhizobium sp. LSJC269B00]|uniref:hypothetical protein n=1 Tax=Mesorhizobium sp. LSJC269B00 TaxID=1287326 RepID=UPI0003CF35F5|nr:hypothetical protein [Mesorhizobium sp. LSJC269B00]ESW93819.1 hypothetical protein X770_00945 [Mesorhizobium sp. LSJC269B00]